MRCLWDVVHPDFMTIGNYFHRESHRHAWSFGKIETDFERDDFFEEFNWVVRWDWLEGQAAQDVRSGIRPEDCLTGERLPDKPHLLVLHLLHQRNAELFSLSADVSRDDEPAVAAFLETRWQYMRRMWEPFADRHES